MIYFYSLLLFLYAVISNTGCEKVTDQASISLPDAVEKNLASIDLPPGFKIDIFADGIHNARSMTQSPGGVVYVGTRHSDKVYALQDEDGDGKAEKQYIIASGLDTPNGVAYYKGDLYIAEVNRILRIPNVEKNLADPEAYEVVNDSYPEDGHHGWKFIAFGPDDRLYVPVGAPCNICERELPYASITSIKPDGSDFKVYAEGVRNTVGFDWHPVSGNLWFTDNGRDMMGDNIPPCELNRATRPGQHFGYPNCHGGDIADPRFGDQRDCSEFQAPAQNLGPHVAPLGMRFYTGNMFPEEYRNQIFIAEHGSWNRSKKIGYRITLVTLNENQQSTSYEVFAEGWLDDPSQEVWGRPVDVLVRPDGSLLVSDDRANAIYRITYQAG